MNKQNIRNISNSGFSLLELMISMTVFLLTIGIAFQLLNFGTSQKNSVNTRVDSVKGARIALNYIRRDVINAGLSYHNIGGLVPDNYAATLIGSPSDADTQQDFLTGIIAGDNVSDNVQNPGKKMDAIGLVTRDLSFNDGKLINFSSTTTTGSSVIVQGEAGKTANCQQYDLYLFATGTTQVVGIATAVDTATDKITLGFSPLDPININLAADGQNNAKSLLVGAGVSGSFKKVQLTAYKIDATGNLIRTTYGNMSGQPAAAQIDSRALISDVKDFQITYLLDNGTTTNDPSSGNDGRVNQQIMNKVVEVIVSLTVNDSQTNTNAPVTLREVISTRNLRYTIG